MRDVVNISLPKELSREIDRLLERGRYSTRSEFLRELIRDRIAKVRFYAIGDHSLYNKL